RTGRRSTPAGPRKTPVDNTLPGSAYSPYRRGPAPVPPGGPAGPPGTASPPPAPARTCPAWPGRRAPGPSHAGPRPSAEPPNALCRNFVVDRRAAALLRFMKLFSFLPRCRQELSYEPPPSTRAVPRLHADRAAGGDSDHRHPHRPAPARRPEGPRGRRTHAVLQQPQAVGPGLPQLPRRQRPVAVRIDEQQPPRGDPADRPANVGDVRVAVRRAGQPGQTEQ